MEEEMSNWCSINSIICEYATNNCVCSLTACSNIRLVGNTYNYSKKSEEEKARAEMEKKASNNWHTGTPTETGEYLVCRVPEAGYLFRYNQLCVFSDLMGILDHKIFYIGEVGKNSFENITDSVIAWQKIEPYKGR